MAETRYYVCAINHTFKRVEVFDREDNTVCLMTLDELKKLAKQGVVIDGNTPSGVHVSQQALDFKQWLNSYHVSFELANPTDFEEGLSFKLSHYFELIVDDVCTVNDDIHTLPKVVIDLYFRIFCYINKNDYFKREFKFCIGYSDGLFPIYEVELDCSAEFIYYMNRAFYSHNYDECNRLFSCYFRSIKDILGMINLKYKSFKLNRKYYNKDLSNKKYFKFFCGELY